MLLTSLTLLGGAIGQVVLDDPLQDIRVQLQNALPVGKFWTEWSEATTECTRVTNSADEFASFCRETVRETQEVSKYREEYNI